MSSQKGRKQIHFDKQKFATSIQFIAYTLRENLSNQSSGEQKPRDICTRFGCYLYSTKYSWIINKIILNNIFTLTLNPNS